MKHKLNQIILADCMDIMRDIPDKYFELAIVDPPYGIGASNDSRVGGFYTVNLGGNKKKVAAKNYAPKEWDNAKPSKEYFKELLRVSQNQIIWGGNYFINNLEESSCWLVWDKKNGANNNADCELAWTSFKTAVRKFEYKWNGMLQEDMKNKEIRQHPTQKPVALYKWLLMNYAKPGDKIIDTHSGSGSCAIACFLENHDFLAIEKDADYHAASVKRFEDIKAQGRMF